LIVQVHAVEMKHMYGINHKQDHVLFEDIRIPYWFPMVHVHIVLFDLIDQGQHAAKIER